MIIKSGRIVSYNSWCVNDSKLSDTAKKRLEKISLYEALKKEGCSTDLALDAVKTKRSTLYSWKRRLKEQGIKGLEPKTRRPHHLRKNKWSEKVKQLVLKLRRKYPYWGKAKIHRLLLREYGISTVSVSTVGRILQYWIDRNKILSVFRVITGRRPRRAFKKHAQRLPRHLKAKKLGELIQIDHMTVSKHIPNIVS